MKIAICGLRGYGLGQRHDLDALLADWQHMFPAKAFGTLFLTRNDPLSAATHVLIINYGSLPAELNHVPKCNILHMSMEPVAFLPMSPFRLRVLHTRARMSIGGVVHPQLVTATKCRPGYVLVPSPSIRHVPHEPTPWARRAIMSIVFSNAASAPGHKYRHQLARAIWQAGLPVDFWGHGAQSLAHHEDGDSALSKRERIKGSFRHVEPYENYKFTIAIENHQEGYYFTEKVTLPIYCGCMPLYLGSPRIHEFFPASAVCALTGSLDTDLQLIKQIIDTHSDDWQARVAGGRAAFQEQWHWGDYIRHVFSNTKK